jgi:hypothetical protein
LTADALILLRLSATPNNLCVFFPSSTKIIKKRDYNAKYFNMQKMLHFSLGQNETLSSYASTNAMHPVSPVVNQQYASI